MACRSWLEASCECDQPCNNLDPGELGIFDNSYQLEDLSNEEQVKQAFISLAQVFSDDYAKHIVWQHFEELAKLLNVELT